MTRNDNSETSQKEECSLTQNYPQQEGAEGRMPAMAPLANPYVPFQMENPPRYEAQKGIVRGTLFPGLDLPFMGMVNKNPLPGSGMSELQALAFAVQELALYLDTHSGDREALELYRGYQELYKARVDAYIEKHGPLNHQMISNSREYDWLNEPWPWEYSKNKEA